MSEQSTGEQSTEKGAGKPGGRIDRIPLEQRGAHTPRSPQKLIPPTDEQINDDFLAAFTPLESLPATPQAYEPEVHIDRKEPDKSPSSINLPIGTVIYDEDGEAYRIDKATEADGEWVRPPKSKGGPAIFKISTIYPNGRNDGGEKVSGQHAKRKGKGWYGQTSKDINPSR